MDFQGRYLEIWVAYIPMNFMCDNVLVCHREVHHAEASLLTTIFPEKIRKYVITTIGSGIPGVMMFWVVIDKCTIPRKSG